MDRRQRLGWAGHPATQDIGWFWNTIALVTAGLWLIVVIVRVVNRKVETRIVTVDAYGTVAIR